MLESENFSKESNGSQETKHFTYVDKSGHPDDKIVFECDAVDILEADEKYKEATGKDVVKQGYVGCQISK